MKYQKVILKLSGETLSGPDLFGFDFKRIKQIAEERLHTDGRYHLKPSQ